MMAGTTTLGRPRKGGARYASGDRKPVQPDDVAPVKLRRLADAAMAKACDPIFGTPLGLMHAAREITDSQFAAGRKYVALRAEWHRHIDARQPTARSPSLMPGIGGEPPQDLGDAKTQERARKRFERARHAVLALPCGLVTLATVERICVEEHAPSWCEKQWLKPALTALAVCFRMIPQPRS